MKQDELTDRRPRLFIYESNFIREGPASRQKK
jgi:hypothetical protein